MDKPEEKTGAEWLIGEMEKERLVRKLMAAMDIVQESTRRVRRKPNERYDGRFFWPGNKAAWARLVELVYRDLSE